MKLRVEISVGLKSLKTGETKILNRTAVVHIADLRKAAIIKIPVDARGKEFVDVKIEEVEDEKID